MKGSLSHLSGPQGHREAKIEEQPTPWEPLDFHEAAATWRRKAEEHWQQSRRLDELAVGARRRAEAAEEMAQYYDGLVADAKPVAEERRGGGTPRPP